MDELIKMILEKSSKELANITIKAAPFGVTAELKQNQENIQDLANYIEANENDIEEIIRRNVKKLGVELQEFIQNKMSRKNKKTK